MNQERKVILYIAVSLDGYIATRDHSLEWLMNVEGEGDAGYEAFYRTVDTIIMGKRTYDWIIEMEKDKFPYQGKQCFVYSWTTEGQNEHAVFVQENPESFLKRLKQDEGRNIWLVGGGELVHAFMEAGLIDEFILTIAPTVIGSGIPLFKNLPFETSLVLKDMKRFGQFVQMHYSLDRRNK